MLSQQDLRCRQISARTEGIKGKILARCHQFAHCLCHDSLFSAQGEGLWSSSVCDAFGHSAQECASERKHAHWFCATWNLCATMVNRALSIFSRDTVLFADIFHRSEVYHWQPCLFMKRKPLFKLYCKSLQSSGVLMLIDPTAILGR